jgi:hypothetical protein
MEALSLSIPIIRVTNTNYISLSAATNYASLSSLHHRSSSSSSRPFTLVRIHFLLLYLIINGLFFLFLSKMEYECEQKLIFVAFLLCTLQKKTVVRVQAESEDFELKQVRDMAAAKKRWETLVFFILNSISFGTIIHFDDCVCYN